MKSKSRHKPSEEEYGIKDSEGKPLEIPLDGSMGLLTLGYRGLMAWRAKRVEAEKKLRKETDGSGE